MLFSSSSFAAYCSTPSNMTTLLLPVSCLSWPIRPPTLPSLPPLRGGLVPAPLQGAPNSPGGGVRGELRVLGLEGRMSDGEKLRHGLASDFATMRVDVRWKLRFSGSLGTIGKGYASSRVRSSALALALDPAKLDLYTCLYGCCSCWIGGL